MSNNSQNYAEQQKVPPSPPLQKRQQEDSPLKKAIREHLNNYKGIVASVPISSTFTPPAEFDENLAVYSKGDSSAGRSF